MCGPALLRIYSKSHFNSCPHPSPPPSISPWAKRPQSPPHLQSSIKSRGPSHILNPREDQSHVNIYFFPVLRICSRNFLHFLALVGQTLKLCFTYPFSRLKIHFLSSLLWEASKGMQSKIKLYIYCPFSIDPQKNRSENSSQLLLQNNNFIPSWLVTLIGGHCYCVK